MKDSIREQYEKYVVNIDVAQQLYGCGFRYPCMFFWIANPKLDTLSLYRSGIDLEYIGPPEYRFNAPTAAEIKEHFPNQVWVHMNNNRSQVKRPGIFHFAQHNGKHVVSLAIRSDDADQIYELHREEDTNEANANGLMFCFIFENHLDQLHI